MLKNTLRGILSIGAAVVLAAIVTYLLNRLGY